MSTDVRVELLKIRTTRLWLWLLALSAGLTLLVILVSSSRSGDPARDAPSLATATGLRQLVTDQIFTLLICPVLGAVVASGEFRHRTATDTYLDQPNRLRVMAAKAIAAGLVGLLFGVVGAAITTVGGVLAARAQGYGVSLPAGSIAGYVAGAILAAALLAAIGAVLGSLVRGQLQVSIGILVWGLGVESVLIGLSPSVGRFLPLISGGSLAGEGAGGGMPPLPPDFVPLPFLAATALLVGLGVVLAVVAANTTVRADVT